MNKHPVVIAAVLLALFAVTGSGLVAVTYEQTKDRILANEREALLRSLHKLVPETRVDNDMIADVLEVTDPDLLGAASTTVYRGRKADEPVAVVLNPIVPDGYSGPIKLLVGIWRDGTLAGVRVVSHRETPGLGDGIEEQKSDWILGFDGKSLGNPDIGDWKVKRDGGSFDQFTGATITPRSIVKAVKNTLLFYSRERDGLFSASPTGTSDKGRESS